MAKSSETEQSAQSSAKSTKADKVQAKLTKRQQEISSKSRLRRITKTKRHSIRTNNRVLKYGAKSFVRNAWLSAAAIAIMTVTLLVLATTVIATNVLGTAIAQVEERVDYSIYIKQIATDDQINEIVSRMEALDDVTEVTATSPEESNREAIRKMINDSKITDQDIIKGLYEAPNKMPWILNVKLVAIDDTSSLEYFVENDSSMRNMLDAKEPTYKTENRSTVNNIANIMNRIRMAGLIAAAVFAIIAIMVVFNTIRMSIFNRKEEIYMMRLVGASRWFIVGPFVVEATFYGIISAIVAGAIAYFGSFALRGSVGEILMDPTLGMMRQYWYYYCAALLMVGILIGTISAFLATRKYVKVK